MSLRAGSVGGPTLLPRRGAPSLVNVLVRVRDRRLRFTPLDALLLLEIELERVSAAGVAEDGSGDDIGWAIEAFKVASNFVHDGDSRRRRPPVQGA